MWKPDGRDVGKKQGHLPLGTLLCSCDLVMLGKLQAGIVCVQERTTKPREEDHRCNQQRERTGPNSRESQAVMSAAAGPVGFEARESVLPSYAYPVARYALPAPGRRRETLKLGGGTSGWGGGHAR